MRQLVRGRRSWWIGLCAPALALAAQTPDAPAARGVAAPGERPPIELSVATVPAAGRHPAIVKVAAPGRYSIRATSKSGTALTLVDRMEGPGPRAGAAGESDGRLDLLLDRGEYKLLAEGDDKATGEVRLAVHAFRERHPDEAPQLVETRLVSETLEDLEQISWWLVIEKRRPVAVEAAGRGLADLRLWRDGSWLVDAAPATDRVVPEAGRPLRVRRIATTLEPGVYRVTAYGGTPEPWAEQSSAHPLHVRWGTQRLGAAGRSRRIMGPLGIDRFIVPAPASVFRLELPQAEEARITVAAYDPASPYAASGASEDVQKISVPPVATVRLGSTDGDRLVTVSLAAGETYVLQHLDQRAEYPFEGSGPHWVSTVHTGHAEDAIDATAIVVRSGRNKAGSPAPRIEPFAGAAVEMDGKRSWRRRFNLQADTTLFLHVAAGGKYEVVSRGTPANFALEPFLVTRPKEMEGLKLEAGARTWDLPSGWYVVTIRPDRPGIADVELRPEEALGGIAAGEAAPDPVRAAVAFPSLALDWDRHYTIYLNHQPEVDAGAIVRPLPLDLGEPLPIALRPGETVDAEFQAADPGKLRAETESGGALEVSIDGGAFGRAPRVAAGRHRATVRNDGDATAVASLSFLTAPLDPATPLASLTAEARRTLPDFPPLAAGQPRFSDLDSGQSASFLVRADEDGLYELSSTGLLATAGVVRTRIQPSLFHAEAGGSGRNFRIGTYLRAGDYQLTVQPRGESKGHLGVVLARSRLQDGGKLDLGVAARTSLAAGDAVLYRFTVARAGSYHVESLGLGRQFRCRLEDADGWPVMTPGGTADVVQRLEPGSYRLVLLPEPVESRRVTTISRVKAPPRFAGHGPHKLPLAAQAHNVWTEPEGDRERVPDVWEFDLAAPADVTVALGGEMHGPLSRRSASGAWQEVGYVPPLRGFKGRLEAGLHRLSVTCVRRNNRAPYDVEVTPRELVPGLERRVNAPAELPLSIGAPALVEITSTGSADVRATLLDAGGREVGRSDDRPDDWNFRISTLLGAGAYRLRVDPVGATAAETTVALRLPKEVQGKPLGLPVAKDLKLKNLAAAWPIAERPPLDGLLVAALAADEAAGVGIEQRRGEQWIALASSEGRAPRVAVPIAGVAAADLRVRVWRLGRPGMAARLSVALASPVPASEAALARGVTLVRIEGLEPGAAAARVDLAEPGLLRLADPVPGLVVAARDEAAGLPSPSGLVLAGKGSLWLVAGLGKGAAVPVVTARRERLQVGEELQLEIDSRPAAIDLDPGAAAGPLAIEVRSLAGQPAVSLAPSGARDLAVSPRRGLAAAPDASPRVARLWRADGDPGPLEVRVRLLTFAAAPAGKAGLGLTRGTLPAGAAVALDLASDHPSLHLVLAPGVLALVSRGQQATSLLAAAADLPLDETLDADGSALHLLSVAGVERTWQVAQLPGDEGALALGGRRSSWESRASATGSTRLRIAAPACGGQAARLSVGGAAEEATLVREDGGIEHGRALALAGAGDLLIAYRPGAVVAWLSCPDHEAEAIWGEGSVPSDSTVAVAAGAGAVAARMRFSPAAPAILHLRAPLAAVTRLTRPGLPVEAAYHAQGLALDALLPAGTSTLEVREIGRSTWSESGEAWLEPIGELAEGLGPEVLLAPGGSRFLGFRLDKKTTVGLGLQVLAGQAGSVLRDQTGQVLGEGVVQMKELEAGSYLFELRAPAEGSPARVRPALAGLAAPGLGPPEDVVRGYLGLAGKTLPGEAGFGRVIAPAAPLSARAFGPGESAEPTEQAGSASASEDESSPAEEGESESEGEGDSGATEEGE